jgi:hypothetical protein
MLWTREYEEYFYRELDVFDLIFGSSDDVTPFNLNATDEKRPLDSSKLLSFLESPFHRHWKGFIRIAPDK